jgi:hypothetical protein
MKVIKHKDKWYLQSNTGYKEILLSTDTELQKDGVQAIDDEFLEWFVKNPSCESVEVNKLCYGALSGFSDAGYKIIISKEKPKQDWYCPKCQSYVSSESVTFEETHQICNTSVVIEEPKQETLEKDLYNDKVEISVLALIEIKRAFGSLIKDENSYVHKVFMDDYVYEALRELKSTYAEYFDEQIKDW